jgi:hypothetical protein
MQMRGTSNSPVDACLGCSYPVTFQAPLFRDASYRCVLRWTEYRGGGQCTITGTVSVHTPVRLRLPRSSPRTDSFMFPFSCVFRRRSTSLCTYFGQNVFPAGKTTDIDLAMAPSSRSYPSCPVPCLLIWSQDHSSPPEVCAPAFFSLHIYSTPGILAVLLSTSYIYFQQY